MVYNVNLSADSIKELQKLIGLNDGNINLNTGVIRVTRVEDVEKIAKKFKIDNIDSKPYQELTKEERNKIIGNNLEVGSVVRVKGKNGVEHAVIIAVDGNKYTVARLILSARAPQTDSTVMILLKKRVDIIYRNMCYRNIVTLMGDIASGLEREQFSDVSGRIVGKVINLDLIQPIINLAQEKDNQEVYDTERCNAEGE